MGIGKNNSGGGILMAANNVSLDRKSKGEMIFLWILCIIFAIYTVTLLYPVFWTILNSFKSARDFSGNYYGLPQKWMFSNYREALKVRVNNTGLGIMYLNSIILTAGAEFLVLLMSSLSGYIFAKYKFPGSKIIYNFMIVMMMIPSIANVPATYKFLSAIGLYNTHFGVMLIYCGAFGMPFLYIYNFYTAMPWSYAESAMIDGANDWQIFIKIMVPQTFGLLAAIFIMTYGGIWGDYTNQMLYMKDKPTITVGIKVLNDYLQARSQWPISFAAMLVSALPMGILYIFANKFLYGISIDTGIKG